MSFHWPSLLWLLLAVPALIVLYVLVERRRSDSSKVFVSPAMKPNVAPHSLSWRRHVPPALLLAAIAMLLIGLARPERALSVPRERATVMVVLDASKSMSDTDIPPNRLEVARGAVRTFLEDLPRQFRVGLVTFGRDALTLSAPTTDRAAINRALDSIQLTVGTALGDGIVRAVEFGTLTRSNEQVVAVILSDGNDLGSETSPEQAAVQAQDGNVRLDTIAMGDPNMTGGRYKPPDYDMLRNIARATGGRFYEAVTAEGLSDVYRDVRTRVTKVTEIRDMTYAFVGGATVLVLIAASLGLGWLRRVP